MKMIKYILVHFAGFFLGIYIAYALLFECGKQEMDLFLKTYSLAISGFFWLALIMTILVEKMRSRW